MKAFDFKVAQSVSEAVTLLAEKGEQARPIAGGTDIIVQLRAGRFGLERLVDVKSIPETTQISYDQQHGLYLGAAVTCCQIYEDRAVKMAYPSLVESAALIGSVQIQGRASVGGNLCNSAPSADSVPSLITLGAICTIAGPKGTRHLPVGEFCTGPGKNALGAGEFLVSLSLPAPAKNSGAAYLRFIPRNEMDIAVAGVGASVVLDESKEHIVSGRVALASVGPTPIVAAAAGAALAGRAVSKDTIEAAAEAAMAEAKPISDMRGTVRQRQHLVGVLTRRALQTAIARAKGW